MAISIADIQQDIHSKLRKIAPAFLSDMVRICTIFNSILMHVAFLLKKILKRFTFSSVSLTGMFSVNIVYRMLS